MITLPMGTQAAQIPIGRPRRAGGNHMLITAGDTTAIKPTPTPSRTRPSRTVITLSDSAPTLEPVMENPRAMRPTVLGSSRVSKNAEGMARMTVAIETVDINQPPVTMPMSSSLIRVCITGGTLNRFIATAMPAQKATAIIAQALRSDVIFYVALRSRGDVARDRNRALHPQSRFQCPESFNTVSPAIVWSNCPVAFGNPAMYVSPSGLCRKIAA